MFKRAHVVDKLVHKIVDEYVDNLFDFIVHN